jgi:hypothetical protein
MMQSSIIQSLSASQDRSSKLMKWLDRLSRANLERDDYNFRRLNDELDWDDVQLLCEATGHVEMLQLMRRGADPFGV